MYWSNLEAAIAAVVLVCVQLHSLPNNKQWLRWAELLQNQVQQPDSMPHADGAIKLGAGYKSAVDSRALEKNTVEHDDERLQLGVKYHTQGGLYLPFTSCLLEMLPNLAGRKEMPARFKTRVVACNVRAN